MRKSIKLIWSFMRPYRGRYAALLALNLSVTALECGTLLLVMPILQSLMGPAGLVSNTRLMMMLSRWFPINHIKTLCWLVIAFALVKFVVRFAHDSLAATTGGKIMFDLREKIFREFAFADLDELLTERQGRLIHLIGLGPSKVAGVVTRVPTLLVSFGSALAIIGLLFSIHWKLMLVVSAAGLLLSGLASRLIRMGIYNNGKETAATMAETNNAITELLTGFRQIVVFNARPRWIKNNLRLSDQLQRLYANLSILQELPRNVMDLLSAIIVAFLVMMAFQSPNGFLSAAPATVGFFLVSFLRLIPNISGIMTTQVTISSSLHECEAIRDVVDRPEPVQRSGLKPFPGLRDDIRFENIDFEHKGRGPLFRSLDFTINKNKVTALVGKSGAGKSTIVNLLLGFYQPTKGRVLIDGADLSAYDLDLWRQKIGYVSQDTFIFHSTIRNNITFHNEIYSQEQIEQAAKIAHAHDFIAGFPDGYDTVVGERGMKLSGGQQQRIAIARAILRQPEIFIFDEATSSLDPVSEQAVQAAINNVAKNRTTLIISHRLSSVQGADQILLLKDGEIIGAGAHDELLMKQSYYKELYALSTTPESEEGR